MPVIWLTFVTFNTYNNEQQRYQYREKKFRGFCQCHRFGNRAGASPAHQCRQCADAVPLLEDGQLHIVPSEPTRLGRQGHQETGAGDTVLLSRKKGYSVRNLAYMCQFARSYPLTVLRSFIETDAKLITPSVRKITDEIQSLNNVPFTQEPLAQIQSSDNKEVAIMQEPLAQIQDVAQTVAAVYRMPIEDMEKLFLASPVARINWASHVIMLNSSLPLGVGYWYMKQSVEMGWSSNVLKMQIESKLYERQINIRKVNNFTATLPAPQSDLANYLLKDPYIFDLAGAKERADERDIEEQLVKHVTRYLLEMGNGFAFVARQKHFQIGDSDFYADLILYNIKLHAYVVVELKATPFKPEYAGQLNFYINVVDDKLRGENDNKTIGLLLCKGKDEIVAQYALTGYDQPIGISDYQLSKAVPENLKSALPSIEQVEEELTMLLDNERNRQK